MRSIWRIPLAVATLLVIATGAFATPINLPYDEYLCYAAKESKTPVQGKFKDLAIQVKTNDQWDIVRTNGVTKYVSLCNPLRPSPPLGDPSLHLAEYAIKDAKVQAKFSAPTTIYTLADRLQMFDMTVSKPKSLLVRTGKEDYGTITKCKVNGDCTIPQPGDICVNAKTCLPSATPPFPPAPPMINSDYMCYSIKGPKGPFGSTQILDQFDFPESYLANKITKVCAPTAKVGAMDPDPSEPAFDGHLVCYQAKSNKTNIDPMTGKLKKFVAHEVGITNMIDQRYLDLTKVTDHCIPALKAIGMAPTYTPQFLTTTAVAASGTCGALTTVAFPNASCTGSGTPASCCTGAGMGTCVAGGIQGRLSTVTGENSNSTCTALGVPLPCCAGADPHPDNHCDVATTVTCGSLTFGGGGPTLGNPGAEGGQDAGGQTRYNIACSSPSDTACVISGNTGNLAGGVNCTTTGCGGTPPIDATSPVKVCAINTLAAPGSTGTLNLVTGGISLTATTSATVHILTATSFTDTACPRCRTTSATSSPAVFQTGPGAPGVGVCDDDSDATSIGDPCFSFASSGATAGLTTDCLPDTSAGGTAIISIGTTQNNAGASVTDPVGHFCTGQAGITDCTGIGTPQICCSGAGMGSCNNHNGCFGSSNAAGVKYADAPSRCTGISVTGAAAGPLPSGATQTYGTVSCIPPVNAGVVLSGLVNNNAGLPGPVVTSSKNTFTLE